MPKFADRVRETTTGTGTGDLTLAGAITAHRTFNTAFGTGAPFYYVIWNRDVQSEYETGVGIESSVGILHRSYIINSSNSNNAVNFSAGTKDVFCDSLTEGIADIDPGLNECRISLSATGSVPGHDNALPTADQTAKSTIYIYPFRGNRISLYQDNRWQTYTVPAAGISVAVPSTQFRLFDVIAASSAGAVTLVTIDWDQTTGSITGATNASPIVITSNGHGLNVGDMVGIAGCVGNTGANGSIWYISASTANTFTLASSVGNGTYSSGGTWFKINNTRTTGLVDTDSPGVLYRNGTNNYKYLGTGMTTGTSGQCEDSVTKRFLWNFWNQVPRKLTVTDATANWTYTLATVRQARAIGANRVEVVVGYPGYPVIIDGFVRANNSTAGTTRWMGIGVNTTTTDSSDIHPGASTGDYSVCTASLRHTPTAGYTMYNWLERSSAVGTTTWIGGSEPGLIGTVLG